MAYVLATGSILSGMVIVWFVFSPAATDPSEDSAQAENSRPDPAPTPVIVTAVPVEPSAPVVTVDPDEQSRLAAIGTWTDNYQGKRTMTLNEDGTGTMVVELSGLTATLFAKRLHFDMVWSVEEGRMKKQTIGGEPAGKVELILKTMGDQVDEPILELTADKLVLLDKDGETKYTWTRINSGPADDTPTSD
jgi:hypothetical protein